MIPAAARLLRPLDTTLQHLVPPRASRICYLSTPDYSDNAFYMYRHLLRTRTGLEHVWLIRDPAVAPRIRREFDELCKESPTTDHRLRIVSKHSLKGYLEFLRSRVAFHTHGGYSLRTHSHRRHTVCLWHGMPIKCIGALNRISPNRFRTYGSLHVATSDFFRYVIAAAFEVPPERVLVSGLPRIDALSETGSTHLPIDEVRRRVGVEPSEKLITWLPTYRTEGKQKGGKPRSFLDDCPPDLLSRLVQGCKEAGARLLIKLHPKDPLEHVPDVIADSSRTTLLPSADWEKLGIPLYDLLAASDALISDVSSVLIDWLSTDRPLGILAFDPGTYTRDLVFDFRRHLASERFHRLDTSDGLQSFLEACTHARHSTVADSDITRTLYEPQPGSSAERIARHIGL